MATWIGNQMVPDGPDGAPGRDFAPREPLPAGATKPPSPSAILKRWRREHGEPVPAGEGGWMVFRDGFTARIDGNGYPEVLSADAYQTAERVVEFRRRHLEDADRVVASVRGEIASVLAMSAELAAQGRRLQLNNPDYVADVQRRLREAVAHRKLCQRYVREAEAVLAKLPLPPELAHERQREEESRTVQAELRALLYTFREDHDE
jgi:hypothetical protein